MHKKLFIEFLEDSSTFWTKIPKQDYKLKNKLIIILFVIKRVNELLVLFNNTFRKTLIKNHKKRPHICGAG